MAEHAGRVDHVEEHTIQSSSPEKQPEIIVPRAEGQPENEKITGRLILAFVALLSQVICYENTLLIPGSLLSYINADLGPDPAYTWISVSWSLCAAVMVSVAGRLGDIFGRRYFMLCGSAIAFIGTIIGATGKSIPQMIVSGVFFGFAAGIQETYYACLMELVPYNKRTLFIGIGCVCALPCLISPLIAYGMMEHLSLGWRAPYWYMTAWAGVAFLLLFFFYHPPNFDTKYHGAGRRLELAREIDFVGLLLFTAAAVLFLVGLNFGGGIYPWASANTLVPLILGLVLWVVFGIWECFTKSKLPLMPPRLFVHVRSFDVVLAVSFVSGMFYYSVPVIWPRITALLFVPADKIIVRGAYATIPNLGTWVAGISLVLVFSRVKHERWVIVFCLIIQISLIGSLASLGVNGNTQAVATVSVLSCFVNQPLFLAFVIISLQIENQVDIGIASGILSTIRLIGGAVGTAVYSTILADTYASRLAHNIEQVVATTGFPKSETSQLIKAAAANTAKAYQAVPHITGEIIELCQVAVKSGYIHAAHIVWLSAMAFGGLSLICALFIRSPSEAQRTGARAVHLENELSPATMDEEK
ncbi:hypothetical protein H2204_001819 [Knufia peltigerae]|uniref:Major facilitator superfamily (MFS) profile domain-containing protein n=1 Tax=Knufia peltigerae TaxID=1002370 RepID=A0AA39D3E4_9EURO|nr:hypothetical protein H2204_001819 [Knufia peltigerae]